MITEEYVPFHKVIKLLEDFTNRHYDLNAFGFGNLLEYGKDIEDRTLLYPVLFVVPQAITYDEQQTAYSISVIIADRLSDDLHNRVSAISNMNMIAKDLIGEIKLGDLQQYFDTEIPATATSFIERMEDNVGGVALDITLTTLDPLNVCDRFMEPVSYDEDAINYLNAVIDAGGNVDETISGATLSLFKQLKDNELYDKITYMYPFIGAVEDSHKINAIEPGVDDIVFEAGWTHDYSGSTSNGTNYATPPAGITFATDSSFHTSWYTNEDNGIPTNNISICRFQDTLPSYNRIKLRAWNNLGPSYSFQFYSMAQSGFVFDYYTNYYSGAPTSISGFWSNTRTDNVDISFNIETKGSPALVNTGASPGEAYNGTGITRFPGDITSNVPLRYAFITLGQGLTPNELNTLKLVINDFQTTLNRNVI